MFRSLTAVLILAGLTVHCAAEKQVSAPPQPSATPESVIEKMPPPSGPGAAAPFLASAREGLLASWIEPVAGTDRFAVRVARYTAGRWSQASTVVDRNDLFVNWADFPSVVEDANGVVFAHWLQKSGSATYAYDVRMAISRDGGRTWGPSFLLNRDGTKTEHGFVSLAPLPDGGIGATWLDGRKMTPGDHDEHDAGDMTLRYATVDGDGAIRADVELDGRTCECCTTGMAVAGDPIVVYRDRTEDETRDISYVRRSDDGWTRPAVLHADGWKIAGCPVNGPQVEAMGNGAAAAWFTAAGEEQRAYVSFSADGGKSFAKPVRVDDGKPVGRVDLVMLDAGSAIVVWLEHTSAGAEIRARRVSASGAREESVRIADSSAARAAGFPRVAKAGDELWFAWTDVTDKGKEVRLARMRLSSPA